ncbi:MAG: hypothetical protein CSA96_09020 [Bacteroidetes bacterium]|nr:MAG: hypothetical protein CSA96_09020 [Bacteroidota bacterium]
MNLHKTFFSGILLCFLAGSVTAQQIEMKMDHPDEVQAGESFDVTVHIQKGSLTDYSRFAQDLPAGLTASNIDSPNADFSFDNNRVRIIWLKLLPEPEIEVKYRIQVNERLKGRFVLGGVFAYVIDDERKFLNFEKTGEIKIRPSEKLDPSLIVDIKDFEETPAPLDKAPDELAFAMVVRQKPVLMSNGAYRVKLLVKNPKGTKYVRIAEQIPEGYIFEEEDSHNGIVSPSGSSVKFIWMKLPETSEFEVSYKLIPKAGVTQAAMEISGLYTYTKNNQNTEVPVIEMDADLGALSLAQKQRLLQSGELPEGMQSNTSVETLASTTPSSRAGQAKPSISSGARQQAKPKAGPRRSEATSQKGRVVPAEAGARMIMRTRVLGAGSGTYFRVQVIANRSAFTAKEYFQKAGVDKEVLVEQNDGLYKYTSGSFSSYREARAYRDRIEMLPLVRGSFVVAYKDGKRIPMADALR